MCGILGYISKSKTKADGFDRALETLKKRGPDDRGTKKYLYKDTSITFGSTRLAIVDLTSSGRQPMTDESDNFSIVFNGEIYNYIEIKDRLLKKGYRFKSKTDTEVLLNGFIEYGQNIVDQIEGMFAFAIYDKKSGKITVARDHFGKKPFYYFFDSNTFVFASEIKAFLALPSIKDQLVIDQLSVSKYFHYGFIPDPNSFYKNIKKLEPATTFQFDTDKWQIINHHRYWDLSQIRELKSEEGIILEKLDYLLTNAVNKRLIADVPIGILLSGGVDSSLITTIASQNNKNINTYTIKYEDHFSEDVNYADKVSKSLGMKSNVLMLEDRLVKKNFIDMINYLDEPLSRLSIIPLNFISKIAKKKVSVMLDGEGADELFAGYEKYSSNRFNFFHKDHRFLGGSAFLPGDLDKLLKIKFDRRQISQEVDFYDKKYKQKSSLNRQLYIDCCLQEPGFLLAGDDRATMANSIEMRSPFLDKRVAEFAFSLEDKWKINHNTRKYILKKTAEKYLDKKIINRQKRIFADMPLDRWIRSELREVFDHYLFIDSPFLDKDYISRIYNDHLKGTSDFGGQLFSIFIFNNILSRGSGT